MRTLIPDSITIRTSLLFSLLATGVFLAMGLLICASVNQHFKEQDRSELEGKLELVSRMLSRGARQAGSDALRQQLGAALVGHHHLAVRIVDGKGRDFFAAGHARIPDQVIAAAGAGAGRRLLEWSDKGVVFRSIVTAVPAPVGAPLVVAIATDTSHHQAFIASFRQWLVMVGGIGLLLVMGLGWLAVQRGLRPVTTMAKVVQGISANRLQERLQVEAVPLELRPLARAFNDMLDRLADSLRRLSDFSSDLAHELRTPINTLMTQTQVSLSRPRSPEEYREILYSSLEEYERLARMTADMLFLAKADHGLVVPRQETVSLRAEAEALFEFYDALASEKGIRLVCQGDGQVGGDRLMIRRALGNLLSNAIRHSRAGGEVSVDLRQAGGEVLVSVCNTGADIPAEHLSRVFDRFYRGDAARQRGTESAGLGLAITRSIVHAHQGGITVRSGGGRTCFDIRLPALPGDGDQARRATR